MFDYLEVESNFLDIDDVATGLANQCRFGGHASAFYSIAEHSVRASYVDTTYAEPITTTTREMAYEKLMHDTAESVMLDVMTPLKSILPDYQALLERVERKFARDFDFSFEMPQAVKLADLIMLATEKRDLQPNSGYWAMLEGIPVLPERIEPWKPAQAKRRFLERYQELRS